MNASKRIRSLGGAGILTPGDLPALTEAAKRLEVLMLDGVWHSATEIIEMSGQREGLRRMRELRTRYTIHRKRQESLRRDFWYRLEKLPSVGQQARLFA
jgi:hypothetical protein